MRKKEGVKENGKDSGMSRRVNGFAIYLTGKECKRRRFGGSRDFAFRFVKLACLVDIHMAVLGRQFSGSMGLREALP